MNGMVPLRGVSGQRDRTPLAYRSS
jgi:hypothetical protein